MSRKDDGDATTQKYDVRQVLADAAAVETVKGADRRPTKDGEGEGGAADEDGGPGDAGAPGPSVQ